MLGIRKKIESTLPTTEPAIAAAINVAPFAPRKNSQNCARVVVPEKSAYRLMASRLAKKN
jgi:hypothetical protein